MTASSTTSTHAPSYGISPIFSPTITYAPVTISLGADLLPQLTDARGGGLSGTSTAVPRRPEADGSTTGIWSAADAKSTGKRCAGH